MPEGVWRALPLLCPHGVLPFCLLPHRCAAHGGFCVFAGTVTAAVPAFRYDSGSVGDARAVCTSSLRRFRTAKKEKECRFSAMDAERLTSLFLYSHCGTVCPQNGSGTGLRQACPAEPGKTAPHGLLPVGEEPAGRIQRSGSLLFCGITFRISKNSNTSHISVMPSPASGPKLPPVVRSRPSAT